MARSKTVAQPPKVKKAVVKKIADYFKRNGYFRLPDEKPLKKNSTSKKGYEIRFVAKDKKELGEMKSLLKEIGLMPGKPFDKFNQFVLPVYGKEKYLRFRNLLSEHKIRIRTHKK
ncbi:hypothetical protein [Ignavibacterium album]|uniref:hypothetical protein n=1 Tax=Ignavibacterium album TaxID=591197 RepID=UPI0035BA4911